MTRRFGLILIAALGVIGVGLAAMSAAGAPRSLVLAQGVVGLIAVAAAGALAWRRPSARGAVAWTAGFLALAALAAAFLHPGVEGVHRWVGLGPLQVQTAPLALAVVAWLAGARAFDLASSALVMATALGVALHPDPQAATGLALAVAVAGVSRPDRRGWGVALAAALAGAVWAWTRPDPLAPVEYVEGVLDAATGAGLGAAAWLALAAVPVLVALAGQPRGPAGLALAALWAGFVLAALTGRFPVPVVGFGLSWALAFGLSLGLNLNEPKLSGQARLFGKRIR